MYFKKVENLIGLINIYEDFKYLDNYYPNFQNWYYNKLVPNIMNGNGTALTMMNRNEIIGISFFKEDKLQAIRVLPKYQNKGKSMNLLDETFKLMDNDKPFCSVAEELFHDYSRIFINRYDFIIPKVEKGIYRKGKLEYLFNEKQNLKIKTGY